MSVEDPVEMALVGVCEMIGPPQQGEAGSEQVRFVCWWPLIGVGRCSSRRTRVRPWVNQRAT